MDGSNSNYDHIVLQLKIKGVLPICKTELRKHFCIAVYEFKQ